MEKEKCNKTCPFDDDNCIREKNHVGQHRGKKRSWIGG
jgi:hypothetical protein